MQPELVRRLQLKQVIVHRVPSAVDVGSAPRFSDVPAPPSGSVTAYFEQRVSGVMGDQGMEIEPEDEAESATRDAILAILRDPDSLAEQSRLIGQRLYDAQDKRNPEGIAVVGVGTIDDLPAVAVLKLEHERGVTAEERELENGQFMFELVVHNDLMLTERTVLFKCAVFRPNNRTDWRLEGVAADLQVRGVANFFLTKFLGCRLVEQPSVLTEKFLSASEAWIGSIEDPEKKTRYEIQLLAHLNNNQLAAVDPRGYAQSALTAAEQDEYLSFLVAHAVPRRRFPKDIEAIKGRIKRVAYEYASGIKLVARPQAMEDHVSFEERQGERTRTIIDDDLTKTHGAG
jgi:37-kD nucleoid-associated bacterial protein